MPANFEVLKRLLFDPGSELGSFINQTNWLVLEIGLALSALLTLQAVTEAIATLVVRSRAAQARNANLRISAERLVRFIPSWLLVARRLKTLARQKAPRPTVLDTLAAADVESTAERLTVPRFLVDVPVLLGLVGTLWGLAAAIMDIQPLVAGIKDFEDLPALLAAMVSTLSGMKTAFSASILGILHSLTLAGGVTLCGWVTVSARNLLDRTMLAEVWPALGHGWDSSGARFAEVLESATSQLEQALASFESGVESFGHASAVYASSCAGFEKTGEGLGATLRGVSDAQQSLASGALRMGDAAVNIATAAQTIEGKLDHVQTQRDAGLDRQQLAEAMGRVGKDIGLVVEKVAAIAQGSPELYASALARTRDESKKDLVQLLDHVEDAFKNKLSSFEGSVQELTRALAIVHQRLEATVSTMVSSGSYSTRPTPAAAHPQAQARP